ncbi:hypothetical protein FRX31_006410, partial [Thalictrum thalictroides]
MGDRPTAYFHHAIKERKQRKCIRVLEDSAGNKLETEAGIISDNTGFYKNLFGEIDHMVDVENIREMTFANYITVEE